MNAALFRADGIILAESKTVFGIVVNYMRTVLEGWDGVGWIPRQYTLTHWEIQDVIVC